MTDLIEEVVVLVVVRPVPLAELPEEQLADRLPVHHVLVAYVCKKRKRQKCPPHKIHHIRSIRHVRREIRHLRSGIMLRLALSHF